MTYESKEKHLSDITDIGNFSNGRLELGLI